MVLLYLMKFFGRVQWFLKGLFFCFIRMILLLYIIMVLIVRLIYLWVFVLKLYFFVSVFVLFLKEDKLVFFGVLIRRMYLFIEIILGKFFFIIIQCVDVLLLVLGVGRGGLYFFYFDFYCKFVYVIYGKINVFVFEEQCCKGGCLFKGLYEGIL